MTIEGVPGLLEDIRVSFILPIVVYVMAALNVKFSNYKYDTLMLRLSLSFCVLGFVVFFSSLMWEDRDVLAALWRASPTRYSAIFASSAVLILGILAFLVWSKLRPELWIIRSSKANV